MDTFAFYDTALNNSLQLNITCIIICLLVLIIMLFFCIMNKLSKIWHFILIFIIIASAIYGYFFQIKPYKEDINKHSYVIYDGEFEIKEIYFSRGPTYVIIEYVDEKGIVHNNRYLENCNIDCYNEPGIYFGRFVYSKHSKNLVELSCRRIH